MSKTNRLLALSAALLMVIALAACSGAAPSQASVTPAKSTGSAATAAQATDNPPGAKAREFYSIEQFNTYANYMGVATGWWAKILKEKLNMEITIVAPNVAGTGDQLYQTRTAAGNLGDSIVQSKSRMIDCWNAGLLYDMKDDIANSPNLQKLSTAYESFMPMFDGKGIWAIPGRVSTQGIDVPAGRALNPEVAVYLRYDWYLDIGAPEIDGIDGLYTVVKKMIDAHPQVDAGKTYAFSFFPDWDGNSVRAAHEMLYIHGYTPGSGYIWMTNDGSSTVSVLDEGGIYYQYLKMYNKAYNEGYLDPDSATQTWNDVAQKLQTDGRIAFAWWPFLATSIFDRIDLNERAPYAPVPYKGQLINSPSYNPYGMEGNAYAIGAGAKHPERIMELYDWLASPEGILLTNSQVEGVTYNMKDGEPVLTEFGLDSNPDKLAPESLGGGDWSDGANPMNYPLTHQDDPNELLGGASTNSNLWPSTIALNNNKYNAKYVETYGGYPFEVFKKLGQLVVTPGTDYSTPSEPTEITTIRAQIKEIVQPAGWQMIYAASEAEFEQIWQEMKSKLNDFGLEQLTAYDTQITQEKAAAIQKVLGH